MWGKGARVAVQGAVDVPMAMRAPPATGYFKGSIQGSPGSTVLLAIREDRAMHGQAFQGAKTWALGQAAAAASAPQAAALVGGSPTAGALASRLVRPNELSGKGTFACGHDPSNLAELSQRLGGSTAALNASAATAAANVKVGSGG